MAKPYYQVDVQDLERASTKEEGQTWRAMSAAEQASYAQSTRGPRQEWRKHCRDNQIPRDFPTQAKADAQIEKMAKQFPGLAFVVRELTPIGCF